jgi:hypothetical protein
LEAKQKVYGRRQVIKLCHATTKNNDPQTPKIASQAADHPPPPLNKKAKEQLL